MMQFQIWRNAENLRKITKSENSCANNENSDFPFFEHFGTDVLLIILVVLVAFVLFLLYEANL